MLVNNAGGQYFVPAQDIVAKGWRAVWNLNVEGTRTMTLAAVEHGFAEDGGSVVGFETVPATTRVRAWRRASMSW